MSERSGKLQFLKYYTLFAFLVIGVVTVLLGQVLPILSVRLSLDDARSGTLFLAQFAGSLAGTLAVSTIARRYGFVMTTAIGLGLIVVGLPGLNSHDFAICWTAIFVYGVGLGLTIPAINLLTIDITPAETQTSAINLINFAWGVGAICSQPFVAAVSDGQSLVLITVILVAVVLLLTVLFLSVRNLVVDAEIPDEVPIEESRIWRQPAAWLFVLFGFFVIGIESSLGGWLTTYTEVLRSRGAIEFNATVIFFAFLVLGRGLGAIIARRLSANLLITLCAITLLAGVMLIVSSERLAIVGAALAGLGTSAIFPTNMVRFAKIFGPTATRQAMPIFISGILGSATVSWLVGFVSSGFGSLQTGIAVVLISASLVLLLQVSIVITFRAER